MNDLENKTPEFVLQPNVISRSIYDLSVYARRLIGMAMALVSPNAVTLEDYTVKFSVGDFLKALGMEWGAKTNQLVFNAVNECIESSIKILSEDGEDWVAWTWFGECRLKKNSTDSWQTIKMTFNPALGAALKHLKKAYSAVRLENLGQLHSKYAIRFYEIALSFAGFAGKDGNPENTWYFDYSVMELRTIFGLAKSKYKLVNAFRQKVVDQPIEEVNAAGIGLHIKVEYIRHGRKLAGFRFICRRLVAGEPVPADTTERLRDKYPERFRELLAEIEQMQQEQQELLFSISSERKRMLAEAQAEERLAAEQPKTRGRPRKAAAS